ncbi:protein kinase domain-containing protein [Actinocorallia aurantiaca]|uniref:non-specific serine/threonine protein kinase n=1 Tax=Actinocorallia aurantiaca TaxID=46204 RepID=A0ABN3U204_9ACTN
MRRHMILEDRYELVDLVSRGGMGEVWKGFDRRLNRPVAIKGIRLGLAASDTVVALFQQEAKIGAKLRHPGLTVIHDLIEYRLDDADGEFAAREKGLALVMEFLEGEDLGRLLEERTFSVRETLELGAKIIEALRAAHAAEVIHRDVKPSNVMVLPDGRVKICDFGIAKARDSTKGLTADGMLGTYAYIAPERIQRAKTDARVDLYSFGIVMYELLRGRPPFEGEPPALLHAHVAERPRSLRSGPDGLPGVPEELDRLVLQLLEKDPEDRPRDTGTVLEWIKRIERSLPRLLGNRYELVRRLSSTDLADTYLARDVRSHRDVALRLLRSDLLGDLSSREEFLREVEALPSGSGAVTGIEETGESPVVLTLPFAVFGLDRTRPLRSRLADGPLPAQDAVRLVERVLQALERGHADGLAHPGLTLDTVLLTGDAAHERVRFLTFASRSPAVPGDAPLGPDPRDDLYAVAGIFHELLTGSPPFPGRVPGSRAGPPPALPSALNPFVPAWCDEIVSRAMDPDPERSYQTAAEFGRALRERPQAAVRTPPVRGQRSPGASPLLYLGVGVMIVITLVSTGLLLLTLLRG